MKLLHVAHGQANPGVWTDPFRRALAELGEFEVVEDGASLSEDALLGRLRQADVVLGAWGTVLMPDALAAAPGRVRYLCNVTGTVRPFVSLAHIEAGVPVTNWGDLPAHPIAEGAVCLLLAALKDLHAQIVSMRAGGWALDGSRYGGSLQGLNVGIYGFGVIGRRFAEMLQPFGCALRAYDPYVEEFPPYVTRVASLEELFSRSEAVSVHVGLNDTTRGSVTAELLARLPRHGVVVNTARGDVIDQEALFAELRSGRLRAALDVLAGPDNLPPEHPGRTWENLTLTGHSIARGWPDDGQPPTQLDPVQEVCLDNLRRFRDGQPLRFLMGRQRFLLST
jgi:phosphoglycerate dehydrogenase-like enzyme